jgi:hypothetical protein
MRKLLVTASLLATAAAVAVGAGHVAAQGQAQALVIQGSTLIDGNGGQPVANSVIVIQGNRITAVGRAGQVQVPAGAQVINAAGKWITPGLIDAKSNWNWMYGEGFLHWGVTSAMVTGARNDQGIAERDAINHGIFPGSAALSGRNEHARRGPQGGPRRHLQAWRRPAHRRHGGRGPRARQIQYGGWCGFPRQQ